MDPAPQGTLLFIDDDPIYAQFLISSVANAGLPFNLRHLSSLDQALAYVRGDEPYKDRSLHPMPAVVLLGINLGAGSGFPVLSWLRNNGCLENEKVRVVMLTSSDLGADIQQALKLGALSYLVKSPLADSVITLLRKFALSPAGRVSRPESAQRSSDSLPTLSSAPPSQPPQPQA